MVEHIGFEPICYPVCQTGGHPKQPRIPNMCSPIVRGILEN